MVNQKKKIGNINTLKISDNFQKTNFYSVKMFDI